MPNIPDEYANMIETAESAGRHAAKVRALFSWPGLSGAQRAAALVLACMEHAGLAPTPAAVADVLKIIVERAERLFDTADAKHPYEITKIGSDRLVYVASQTLEYGE